MAYKLFGADDVIPKKGGLDNIVGFHSFVCDEEADISNLPDHSKTAFGSVAIIMDTNDVYWLRTDGKWKKGGA